MSGGAVQSWGHRIGRLGAGCELAGRDKVSVVPISIQCRSSAVSHEISVLTQPAGDRNFNWDDTGGGD